MTSPAARTGRALVVIDVQNGVMWDAHDRDGVIARIAGLVDGARATAVPVVWIQHNDEEMEIGSEYWQLVPELVPLPGEPRIDKQYRSSFEATGLDDTLASLDVGEVVLVGAQTNFCIRNTTHAAMERGYDVTIVGDAHSTGDIEYDGRTVPAAVIIDDLNASMRHYDLPGRRVSVVGSDEVFA